MNINARIWENSIASLPEGDPQVHQFAHYAREFFIPDNIAPAVYLANVAALTGQGAEDTSVRPAPSVDRLTIPQERPLAFPTWFLAAYPDVALWFKDRTGSERTRIDAEVTRRSAAAGVAVSHLIDDQGFLAHAVLRILVDLYRADGRTLECTAPAEDLREEGSPVEQNEQTMTTQQAVDLVAGNVTRYERELATSYQNRFRDIRTRLTAAGLLQLGYYVLVDHAIPLASLVKAADESAAEDDPVVEFIERLEVEVFCAEGGEQERKKVVEACHLLRPRILDVVLAVRAEFNEKPTLASATRNFMENPELESLRRMIGIQPPD